MFRNSGANDSTTSAPATGAPGKDTATPRNGFSLDAPQPVTGLNPFGGPWLSTPIGTSREAKGSHLSGSTNSSATGPVFGFSTANSLFGTPVPGATSAEVNPLAITTDTPMPACTVFSEKDPSNPSVTLRYQSITSAPTHREVSSEELRMQAYQQNGSRADTTPFGAIVTSPTSLFGMPNTTQFATGSMFGTGVNHTSTFGGTSSVFQQPPAIGVSAGSTNAFGQPGPCKSQRIDDLLIKSLLGEELVDTQFHLFSAKSSFSGQVMKPRTVCGSNIILAETKYFSYLSSSDMKSSDPSLVDFEGDNDIPSNACMADYGYESDSDLDDCDDDSISIVNPKHTETASTTSPSPSEVSTETPTKDDKELSEDGFESVGSDTVVVKTEQSSKVEPLSDKKGKVKAIASNEGKSKSQTAMRSLGTRQVLVKDTAFQTWYSLLSYLYTGKFAFLPLSSTTPDRKHGSSGNFNVPKCSAKSMYRLACKVGLDHLRRMALSHIQWNLTPNNILKEISSGLASKHPELLEVELDMLYTYIASPPVVANFGALAQRIALNELPHGSAIIVGIHKRLLKQHHPFSLMAPPASANPDDKAGLDKQGTRSGTKPLESVKSTTNVPPTSAITARAFATSSKERDTESRKKVERRK